MKIVSVVLFVLFLVSFAATQQRWTKAYGGTRKDEGFSVQPTSDGGYIVAGYTASFGAGDSDVYLVKTNASGDTLWTRAFGGANADQAFTIKQTADSGYIIAGWTNSFGAGNGDVYLIKTNASGDTLWTRAFGGVGDDAGYSTQQTADGGYIIAGYTAPPASSGDVYLIKTDANGSLGVEADNGQRPAFKGQVFAATPNPFVSFARILGQEAGRFDLYDISGKMVGTYLGDRVGEGLSPAVYFVRPGNEPGMSLRIVKAK